MRYRLLAFLILAAAIAYMQRVALTVPMGHIAGTLGVHLARDMGFVQSAWYFGYSVMQLPSGWLADRIGSRWAFFHSADAGGWFSFECGNWNRLG